MVFFTVTKQLAATSRSLLYARIRDTSQSKFHHVTRGIILHARQRITKISVTVSGVAGKYSTVNIKQKRSQPAVSHRRDNSLRRKFLHPKNAP